MSRKASLDRTTRETKINVAIDLDGSGECDSRTGIGFFDHMIQQLARHSLIDITLHATGDRHIDTHHTIEDCGLILGTALSQALGEKKSIVRYGSRYAPLDESCSRAVVDISGRGGLTYAADIRAAQVGGIDCDEFREFFHAFASTAKITLHLDNLRGQNAHHQIESIFKATALALRDAIAHDPRQPDIPSTKGTLS